MKSITCLVAATIAVAITACQPIPIDVQVDCADWNDTFFFDAAEAPDVTRCLQSGADPNARDEDGWTPLVSAATFTSNPAVIVALLNAGADPNARTDDGETPLLGATAFTVNPAVIVALLDAGADPNARTDDGWTPLHWAARLTDNSAVIVALLDAGADPNARDEDGWTPWDMAQENDALDGTDALRWLNDARFQ